MFSPGLTAQFNNFARQGNTTLAFVNADLVFIASAAVHPDFLSADRRFASFSSMPHSEKYDSSTIMGWSDAGFFLTPCGGASNSRVCTCFHCGTRCKLTVGQVELISIHRKCSPSCELVRLLSLLGTSGMSEETLATAAKLRRATTKLHSDLRSSALLDRVESFGFERRLIAFTACRWFMRSKDGRLPERPGELIQAIHDSEEMLQRLPESLDLENALKAAVEIEITTSTVTASASASSASASAVSAAAASAAVSAASASASEPHRLPETVKPSSIIKNQREEMVKENEIENKISSKFDEDDSDQCRACKQRVREQVTLPCAHFLLCTQCASHNKSCPKCNRNILATVRAFVA